MHFLPDVYVTCEVCKGKRYNRETLEVKYKGRSISDVLDMSVGEACEFFQTIPVIHRHLQTLSDVGLGYIRMGQPAPTLSGGEAQRVKLASELSKRATGRTFYILDEPTTGLHFEDIRKLLSVLERLAAAGNTVLVIEHNLDVIKTADWGIDLGPQGGDAGGGDARGNPPSPFLLPRAKAGKGDPPPPVVAGQPQPPAVLVAAQKTGIWSRTSVTKQETNPAKGSAEGISFKDGTAGPVVHTS